MLAHDLITGGEAVPGERHVSGTRYRVLVCTGLTVLLLSGMEIILWWREKEIIVMEHWR